MNQKKLEHSEINDCESLRDPDSKYWKQFDAFLETWCNLETYIDGFPRRLLGQKAQLSDNDGKLLVDAFGRFEHYESNLNTMLKKTNLECPRLPRLISTPHRHYGLYYSDFGRELVNHCFKADIETFNYQFGKKQ
ncbi:MAG: hypothetical protein ACFHVJ_17900 [Aestuariibacter sp.]